MVIQHNLSAMNAHRRLGANHSSTAKNLEKLASGFRINRAADDAAGLAISEKMRGQIRGLDQAGRNISDGISLIKMMDGAMQTDHEMLHRIRELLVQSSNGTYDEFDRGVLQEEIDQLMSEIDELSYRAEFNCIKVLRGDAKGLPDWVGLTVTENSKMITGSYTAPDGTSYTAAHLDFSGLTSYNIGDLVDNGFSHTCCTCTNEYIIQFNDKGDNSKDTANRTLNVDIRGITSGAELVQRIVATGGPTFFGHYTNLAVDPNNPAVLVVYDNRPAQTAPASGKQGEIIPNYMDEDAAGKKDSRNIIIHSGANKDETTTIPINTVDTTSLGLREKYGPYLVSVNPNQVDSSITLMDGAINILSGMRAVVGAVQNRLGYTQGYVGNAQENLTASESTIRDLDMAKEMMDFTKNSIIVQSAQAMLVQATQLPQGILSLLR